MSSEVEWAIGRYLQNATPIDPGTPPLTAAEIARRIGVSPSHTARVLRRMQAEGMVDRNLSEGWFWP